MSAIWNIVQNCLSMHSAPDQIVVLIKDLMAEGFMYKRSKDVSGYTKGYYHNERLVSDAASKVTHRASCCV